ncbi:MAG: protein translocase subunit SecD [Anaerolineales bacterium]
MSARLITRLVVIVLVVAAAAYVVAPNTSLSFLNREKNEFQQGLDLQGGIQVLLEADLPAGTAPDAVAMEAAKGIVERRVNGLGVAEPFVQTQGERQSRILVELPGYSDPDQAVATIKETGLLEFVVIPAGELPPPDETVINTYCPDITKVDCANPEQAAPPADTSAVVTDTTPTYVTLMTGAALREASVTTNPTTGQFEIAFALGDEGARIFSDFTTNNVGRYLAIVLDKKIISAPRIESAITGGEGVINGSFTQDSANQLALQLRYGALPVPLKVVESRVVGPSLGQDSLNRSLTAGAIGFSIVVLFMILYYRLPGVVAVLAILTYGVITLALFKLIPVTLSLAGIAGFLLSTGSALDANILIFERLKEELRGGRSLRSALDPAWRRAWPSIRDSNIATVIICAILYWFGSAFGASIVQGFAVTLLIGVLISAFTALVVTRTFLTLAVSGMQDSEPNPVLFGL